MSVVTVEEDGALLLIGVNRPDASKVDFNDGAIGFDCLRVRAVRGGNAPDISLQRTVEASRLPDGRHARDDEHRAADIAVRRARFGLARLMACRAWPHPAAAMDQLAVEDV